MESSSGVPMLNCLLQHTLRSLCAYSDTSPKWIYAVFWRILPRNYPPPKWDYGGSALDRSKGNKRNWILVWEDGHCDFNECEQAARFGADVFFKMTHEVYSYGEGLVGKVAADNSHKWVFRDPSNEGDPTFISSSWNLSIEPQPRAWEVQFKSGIQTIAIVSVREGIIQLGSLDKIVEDLNLVINIQRKFSYLQSIPGVFAMQRPIPHQNPYHALKPNPPITGLKRLFNDAPEYHHSPTTKSLNFGWNTPQNGTSSSPPPWQISQPLSCSLGALLSNLPSVMPYSIQPSNNHHNESSSNPSVDVKLESSSFMDAFHQEDQKPKSNSNAISPNQLARGCSKS